MRYRSILGILHWITTYSIWQMKGNAKAFHTQWTNWMVVDGWNDKAY